MTCDCLSECRRLFFQGFSLLSGESGTKYVVPLLVQFLLVLSESQYVFAGMSNICRGGVISELVCNLWLSPIQIGAALGARNSSQTVVTPSDGSLHIRIRVLRPVRWTTAAHRYWMRL